MNRLLQDPMASPRSVERGGGILGRAPPVDPGVRCLMSQAHLETCDNKRLIGLAGGEGRPQQEQPTRPVLGEAEGTVGSTWVSFLEGPFSNAYHARARQRMRPHWRACRRTVWGQEKGTHDSVRPSDCFHVSSPCPDFREVRAAACRRETRQNRNREQAPSRSAGRAEKSRFNRKRRRS